MRARNDGRERAAYSTPSQKEQQKHGGRDAKRSGKYEHDCQSECRPCCGKDLHRRAMMVVGLGSEPTTSVVFFFWFLAFVIRIPYRYMRGPMPHVGCYIRIPTRRQ